jgi:hypothetical protein
MAKKAERYEVIIKSESEKRIYSGDRAKQLIEARKYIKLNPQPDWLIVMIGYDDEQKVVSSRIITR